MDTKKHSIVGFFVFMLFVSIVVTSCVRDSMYSKTPSLNFPELIEKENIDEISLSIYYISPFILTRYPWDAENLISVCEEQKIVIKGSDLEEQIDLFKQLSNVDLIPVKKKSYLDARLYYVLESSENGKLFDVAMWGGNNNSIFVNGFEVNENAIFYDIVKPFLPEDAVEELENYATGIWPE